MRSVQPPTVLNVRLDIRSKVQLGHRKVRVANCEPTDKKRSQYCSRQSKSFHAAHSAADRGSGLLSGQEWLNAMISLSAKYNQCNVSDLGVIYLTKDVNQDVEGAYT